MKYSLVSTGTVDLDNSGKSRRVGLVSFFDGDSTASDGTYRDIQALPVYLDKNGAVDLSADANHKLAVALPHGMREGRLVTLDGTTYLELSAEEKRPSSEVWKINPGGALKVRNQGQCALSLRQMTWKVDSRGHLSKTGNPGRRMSIRSW